MTRSTFNQLADKLHDCRPAASFGEQSAHNYDGWWLAVRAVADVCEQNPRFDRGRFIKTCEQGR